MGLAADALRIAAIGANGSPQFPRQLSAHGNIHVVGAVLFAMRSFATPFHRANFTSFWNGEAEKEEYHHPACNPIPRPAFSPVLRKLEWNLRSFPCSKSTVLPCPRPFSTRRSPRYSRERIWSASRRRAQARRTPLVSPCSRAWRTKKGGRSSLSPRASLRSRSRKHLLLLLHSTASVSRSSSEEPPCICSAGCSGTTHGYWSRHPVASMITWKRRRSPCGKCGSWCSTKRTGCWIWDSNRRLTASWRMSRANDKRCSFRRPCPRKSCNWLPRRCACPCV